MNNIDLTINGMIDYCKGGNFFRCNDCNFSTLCKLSSF